MIQQGYEVFVEIGPKPALLGWVANACQSGSLAPQFVSRLEEQQLLQSLGALYVRVPVDWQALTRLPHRLQSCRHIFSDNAIGRTLRMGIKAADLSQQKVKPRSFLNQEDTQQLSS